MSRLIDADFLISYIEEELALKYTGHLSDDVVCGMISRQNEIIQFIKAQPTAFNVEAVVDVVKEEGANLCANKCCNNNCDCCVVDDALRTIIDAIRKGGVK